MKRFLTALALTCVLSGSALAGHIDTCGITASEPTTAETAMPGNMPSTDSTAPGEMTGVDVSILLTLLDLAL